MSNLGTIKIIIGEINIPSKICKLKKFKVIGPSSKLELWPLKVSYENRPDLEKTPTNSRFFSENGQFGPEINH